MFDPETLALIKREADRLQQTEGLSWRDSYIHAQAIVIGLAAERQAANPFEARILAEIDRIARNQHGAPVKTRQLAIAMGNMNRDTLHYHLQKLEGRLLICRPHGLKSGWLRVTPAKPALLDGRGRA